MTGLFRPSLPAVALLIGAAGLAMAAEDPLVRALGAAEVDWSKGLIRARAGAAADIRLPGPDATRADAQRRARSFALKILRESLDDLPLGGGRRLDKGAIDGALTRARVLTADYQSNGGVLLELGLSFADLEPARSGKTGEAAQAEALTLAVPSMPLEALPTVVVGKEEVSTAAVYRIGEPPRDVGSLKAKRDRAGRLVVTPVKSESGLRARSGVIIYVRSVVRK